MIGQAFVFGALLVFAGCQSSDVSRSLGARCATSSECTDRCLAETVGYPGGFCTTNCTTSVECAETANCADREGGVCLLICNFDEDCLFLGTGWTCKDTDTRDATKVKLCRGD